MLKDAPLNAGALTNGFADEVLEAARAGIRGCRPNCTFPAPACA